MSLTFFNTLTRQKEHFCPIEKGRVLIYTCGPTVYDFAHIGNLRTYVFEDVLCKTLALFGYSVEHVMNITDIDDKTLKGAKERKLSLDEFTAPYKKAFFADLKSLNIAPARHYPEATAFIEQMIELIKTLLLKKCAYIGADKSVYFSIKMSPKYGKLSHFAPEQLLKGGSCRTANDEYDKKEASDFVLWKAHVAERDGSIFWESPWGRGRPGWHIECSAMAHHYLGPTLDIHAGGVDNIFPHHENEIAQSECAFQKPLANFWMHAEHLKVEGRKMAKSAGNFLNLQQLVSEGADPLAFRLLLLQNHYRTQLNFTKSSLSAAAGALARLRDLIDRLQTLGAKAKSYGPLTPKAESRAGKALAHFEAYLSDDLNTAAALAVLFDWARELNRECDAGGLSAEEAAGTLQVLKRCDTVLGVLFAVARPEEIPHKVLALQQERNAARSQRDWQRSDSLRRAIEELGFLVEDTSTGSKLKASTATLARSQSG